MSDGDPSTGDRGPQAFLRALRRRPVAILLVAIGVVEAIRVAVDPRPLDVPVVVLLALVALVAAMQRRVVAAGGLDRESEAASFARILRGLARSISPDAIVDAIVEELGEGTGASHVAVIRRRPEAGCLEATISATRAGTPQSRTTFPLSDLEDPASVPARFRHALTAATGRRMAALPIEPDPLGDPQLVSLGMASGRATAGGRLAPAEASPGGGRMAGRDRPLPDIRPGVASPSGERSAQRIADHLAERLRVAYGLRNLVAAPLRVGGRIEGAIVLARRIDEPWPEPAREILSAAAGEASAALARVYTLRDAEERATMDALTGLPNRRYFDEYVALLARRRRAEDRVGVLMIDLDRFKALNDAYGHAAGDQVLRAVGRAIAATVRGQDVPARYGGEEFAVLLKNPSPEIALEVGERVRRAIAALDLRAAGVPPVSVSIGVAVAETPDRPLGEVIEEADRAMYRAKRAGRDRVVAA